MIVVGSSPILILAALQARHSGKTVGLVEANAAMGGAWSVDRYTLHGRDLYHENACHLVEWYAGGYELLEDLSSVPFVPLSPQPVKVWRNGRVSNYTSRAGILAEYLSSWRAVAYGMVKVTLAHAGVAKYPRDSARFHLRQAIARVMMDTRFRLPGLIRFDGVRGPIAGYADFIAKLAGELVRQNIAVFRNHAREIRRNGTDLRVCMEDGGFVDGGAVMLGESSAIQVLDGKRQRASRFTSYHHVLISLPAPDTTIRNSYVHFPDHTVFHRITYIEDVLDDDGEPVSLFLLQLRMQLSKVADLRAELDAVCKLYKMATSVEGMKILKNIEAEHISSQFDSGWAVFKAKEPTVLRTIGDLSRNAILMRDKIRRNGRAAVVQNATEGA